jgi:hypothetical protein
MHTSIAAFENFMFEKFPPTKDTYKRFNEVLGMARLIVPAVPNTGMFSLFSSRLLVSMEYLNKIRSEFEGNIDIRGCAQSATK